MGRPVIADMLSMVSRMNLGEGWEGRQQRQGRYLGTGLGRGRGWSMRVSVFSRLLTAQCAPAVAWSDIVRRRGYEENAGVVVM